MSKLRERGFGLLESHSLSSVCLYLESKKVEEIDNDDYYEYLINPQRDILELGVLVPLMTVTVVVNRILTIALHYSTLVLILGSTD